MSTTTLRTQVVTEGRDALSRAVRQAIQALIPTMLVLAAGSTVGLNPIAILGLAGITAFVSILKSAAGFKVPADSPKWALIAERAVTAAAGTSVGLVTVDGFVPTNAVNWQQLLTAAIGSAALAVGMYFSNPPPIAEPAERPLFPEGAVFQPKDSDRGDIDVLLIMLVIVLLGVALLLFGVSFE